MLQPLHQPLKLSSPAKLNLFFRVLRRREDGYHEIASLYQAIDLCDTLTFAPAEVDQLTATSADLPLDQSNLVIQALTLFRQETGLKSPLSIHLEKRIPIQSGLGGGSSNAATTLWALNRLYNAPLAPERLLQLAGQIGADVAFFLSEGTAYCTGRGEQIVPLPPLPPQSLWIVKPPYGLSTPLVYQQMNAAALSPRNPQQYLQGCLAGRADYFNDLEQAAFALAPQLQQLRDRLKAHGFSSVVMSGSGSSLFCIGKGEPPVSSEFTAYPVRFLNRFPDNWY